MTNKQKSQTKWITLGLLVFASVTFLLTQWIAPTSNEAFTDRIRAEGKYGEPLVGTKPAQWRVVWTTDPQTTATIVWTTKQRGKSHALKIDTQSRSDDAKYRVTATDIVSGQYDNGEEYVYYHYARLKNLVPNTTYWFRMVSDDDSSRELHFTTAPNDDRDIKFLYGGDSRSDRDNRRAVNKRIRALATEDAGILCFVHGGDYIYDGRDFDQWMDWLTDWELTTCKDGRVLPIVPARGNHEKSGPLFDEIFDSPGDGKPKNYYETKLTPQTLLLNLNTETSMGGDQRAFLDKSLAANRAMRWQFANYHRPAFPAVKKPGGALEHWVPLFEKYDLDVAFESDGHTIKRTAAVRDGKIDKTGVVYIGEGGLGVRQRTPKADRWYFKGGKTGAGHHVQRVTVTKKKLTVETVLLDGSVFDTWSKTPRNRKSK